MRENEMNLLVVVKNEMNEETKEALTRDRRKGMAGWLGYKINANSSGDFSLGFKGKASKAFAEGF
jgi:hypothetical protein